jgi:hypothetical protein
MSYVPHTWADGQSGADAAPWLNNMEEGVRADTQLAEETAARLNPADAESAYGQALALQPLMTSCMSRVLSYRSLALNEQAKLDARNTFLGLYKGYQNTGAGTDIPITGMTSKLGGAFPAKEITGDGFEINFDGWYMFFVNVSMTSSSTTGLSAKVKIINRDTGAELVPAIYMGGLNDLSFAQEIVDVSACVLYRLGYAETKRIGFTVDVDGSGACINGFRVIVRRL